jgi:hypothetical protein
VLGSEAALELHAIRQHARPDAAAARRLAATCMSSPKTLPVN